MNLNLYLREELGRQAKEAGLPLSRLLSEIVSAELERMKAVSEMLMDTTEHMLEVEDNEGRAYTGRLTGTEVVFDDDRDLTVFLRERDERVVIYDAKERKIHEVDDPEEELRNELSPALYTEAMYALGIKPTIDL